MRHSCVLQTKHLLSRRFADRESALTAVKLHSTLQNKRVVLNRGKSNSVRMEFVCDSCSQCSKSTSSSKVDARFVCGYRAVLRRSKRKEGIYARLPWGFKSGSTVKDLTHSDQCLSKARMTLCEARVHTKNTTVKMKPATIAESRNRIHLDNKVCKKTISTHVAYQPVTC